MISATKNLVRYDEVEVNLGARRTLVEAKGPTKWGSNYSRHLERAEVLSNWSEDNR